MFEQPLQALAPRLFGARKTRTRAEAPAPCEADPALARLEDVLDIPVHDESPEHKARLAAQNHGQFLARQERWPELIDLARRADRKRETTPGGMPVADLLLFGARADVVHAVEHALLDGTPPKDAPLLQGIAALEALRTEFPNDPIIALLVALTHVDIAWAWRGAGDGDTVAHPSRRAFAAHMERAGVLLKPHSGIAMDSPALAAAQCALLPGRANPEHRVADAYGDLIDLDPQNQRHMRAMGNHLLPRWFGTYPQLDLEARRTAARTQSVWGAAGYTWVYFDAVASDADACAHVDAEFFTDGLKDIMKHRPDQEMANLLAAYCAVAMRHGQGQSARADDVRQQIIDCAEWLIRNHLTELYPLIWAHAAEGFDNNARITSLSRFAARGRADAFRAIAEPFREEIERGLHITFTSNGPQLHQA